MVTGAWRLILGQGPARVVSLSLTQLGAVFLSHPSTPMPTRPPATKQTFFHIPTEQDTQAASDLVGVDRGASFLGGVGGWIGGGEVDW